MSDIGMTVGLIKALGSPDPAVIEGAVSDWLYDHPEATTTVEDGAISYAKLDSSLKGTVDDVGDLKTQMDAVPIEAGSVAGSEQTKQFDYYGTMCVQTASDGGAHAEGMGTTASARGTHAEGAYTAATMNFSHAEGAMSKSTGMASHAEGYQSVASGNFSHSECNACFSSGSNSHAEGDRSVASGANSHSQNQCCCGEGGSSHAEGSYSLARGTGSHSEGNGVYANIKITGSKNATTYVYSSYNGTIETGTIIACEGQTRRIVSVDLVNYTITCNSTFGDAKTNANAIVYRSGALANYSHVEGTGCIADSENQHVQGKYNAIDSNSTYVEIVGNGTAHDARSNARTLDWSGNEELAGSITLGKGTVDEVTLSAAQLKQLLALLN